jgi:hypothetical protein
VRRWLTLAAALCLGFAATPAAAQPGSGDLVGRSLLASKGCGRQRASFGLAVLVDAGGTWTAQDSEGRRFAGAWTPRGASGRRLEVSFGPEAEAAFVAVLAGDVARLCEAPVVVESAVKKAFVLTVNRRRTRMALVLRYVLRGSAGGRSGTARYRLKAKGPWTPAAGLGRGAAPASG